MVVRTVEEMVQCVDITDGPNAICVFEYIVGGYVEGRVTITQFFSQKYEIDRYKLNRFKARLKGFSSNLCV